LLNNIREIATLGSGFNEITVSEGRDYSKLENASLNQNEYTYNVIRVYFIATTIIADEILAFASIYNW
jgi:hypothetical protein